MSKRKADGDVDGERVRRTAFGNINASFPDRLRLNYHL